MHVSWNWNFVSSTAVWGPAHNGHLVNTVEWMHEVVNVVEQSLTLETSAVESLLCYLVARYLVKSSDIATILNFKKVSILFLPL